MLKAAYIVPHPPILLPLIGKGEETKIQATTDAYQRIAKDIHRLHPQTIIVCSPHAPAYHDYIHIANCEKMQGDMGRFHASQIQFHETCDTEMIRLLCQFAQEENLPAGCLGDQEPWLDHGTMLPLYFIEQYDFDFKLVVISVSGLSADDHVRFGVCIQKAIQASGKDTVLVASGDLSHKLKADGPYGYCEEGVAFDTMLVDILRKHKLDDLLNIPSQLCEKSAQCGLPSFWMMLGALREQVYTCEVLSYEGVFGVGYATAMIHVLRHDRYTDVARQALETYVREKRVIQVQELKEAAWLERRAAVFVSLQENGELRGCIGTILPTKANIAEEIISNAISAGTRDPRFYPVDEEELARLVYDVDELSEPQRMDSFDDLDVKRYGVIVSNGMRRGLLLPNLKGVDTVKQQVNIALQKAGIDPEDTFTLERFEVIRHEECPM